MNGACTGSRWSSLVGGVILIAVGAIFLAGELRIADFHRVIREWWPMIFVLIGAPMLFDPERRGGGLTMIAIGAWMQVSTMELFGLDWSSSWPVLLILIGGAMILNAIIDALSPRREPREKGAPNVPQE